MKKRTMIEEMMDQVPYIEDVQDMGDLLIKIAYTLLECDEMTGTKDFQEAAYLIRLAAAKLPGRSGE